jgi:hypothetical protein
MTSPIDRRRADREVIERAARALRNLGIADGYAGAGQQPARAFAMALLLDELALHVRDLDDAERGAVVQSCRALLDRPES